MREKHVQVLYVSKRFWARSLLVSICLLAGVFLATLLWRSRAPASLEEAIVKYGEPQVVVADAYFTHVTRGPTTVNEFHIIMPEVYRTVTELRGKRIIFVKHTYLEALLHAACSDRAGGDESAWNRPYVIYPTAVVRVVTIDADGKVAKETLVKPQVVRLLEKAPLAVDK